MLNGQRLFLTPLLAPILYMVKHDPAGGEQSHLARWLHIACSPGCLLWLTPVTHIAELSSRSLGDGCSAAKEWGQRELWWTSICSYASLIHCHFFSHGCLMQTFGA